ncbi:MAG: hypothetical protein Q8R92_16930 [Deltaproteobacteria bacterium]|nr:hypothetical protein [Deltaproteobacteria bacterium]
MPRVREYTQQIGAQGAIQGRRAAPGDSFALGPELGRAIGGVSDLLQDTAERQEVSDIQAKLAKARAEWTVHLVERAQATSPGDATFAGKFNEDFNTYLQQLEGQAQTRAGQNAFRKGAAGLAAHFVEKAGVYQAQSMGAKASQDYLVSLDARRAELLSDPTQFQALLVAAIGDLNDPAGVYAKMPVADREKLTIQTQQELAMSAVRGLIQNGAPELARRQLDGGQWDQYLDADKKAELIDKAAVGIRGKDVEARRIVAELKAAEKEKQDAVASQFVARMFNPDGNPLRVNDVLKSGLPAERQEHFLRLMETRAKEQLDKPIKTVPSVMTGAFEAIRSGKITTISQIEDLYGKKGQVSFEDMNRLRKEFTDARTDAGSKLVERRKIILDGFKPQIDKSNPLMGKLDPTGAAKFAEFQVFARDQEEKMRQAGDDPHDLYRPKSPAFIGNYVPAYYTSMQDSLATARRRITGGAKPLAEDKRRKPDESIAEWKKRTGL